MSKILGIIQDEPDPYVIEKLEKLLEQAKSGELRGFAYCGFKGRNIVTGILGTFDYPELVFALSRLTWSVHSELDEREIEEDI